MRKEEKREHVLQSINPVVSNGVLKCVGYCVAGNAHFSISYERNSGSR